MWVWALSNNYGVIIAWVSGIMGTSFLESNKFSTTVSISASVLSIKMDSFNLYASLVTNYSFFLINSESNFIDFSTSHGLGFLHVARILASGWLLVTDTFDMVKWFNYILLHRQGILHKISNSIKIIKVT